eukprot:4493661-Heterocapsa_arctica.AAC.1
MEEPQVGSTGLGRTRAGSPGRRRGGTGRRQALRQGGQDDAVPEGKGVSLEAIQGKTKYEQHTLVQTRRTYGSTSKKMEAYCDHLRENNGSRLHWSRIKCMLIQSTKLGKHDAYEQNHNTVRLIENSDSTCPVRIHWSGAAGGETTMRK